MYLTPTITFMGDHLVMQIYYNICYKIEFDTQSAIQP